MKKTYLLLILALLFLPVVAHAQDDCPANHIRNVAVSPLDHDYMVRAFTASFRGLFGRDPSMQPGSGKDDGEYYISAANHFGVYGDDQCHAGWSGYWESWLQTGHGDLGAVQTPAHYLPSAPVVTPPVVTPPTPPGVVYVPTPPTAPLPATDLSPVLNQQAIDHAILVQLQLELAAARKDVADFREAVRSRWVAVVDSPIFKYGLAAVAGWFIKNAVKP